MECTGGNKQFTLTQNSALSHTDKQSLQSVSLLRTVLCLSLHNLSKTYAYKEDSIHSEKTSIFDKEIKSTKIKQSEKKDMTESNAK